MGGEELGCCNTTEGEAAWIDSLFLKIYK